MTDEIWVLGGSGRTGRATASRLVAAGLPVVLVGRQAQRLEETAVRVGASRWFVAETVEAMAAAVREQRPKVVANTVGPFARTAELLARAALPHSSYLDIANDFVAAQAVLALHEHAAASGRTLVTGAGFGVLATEAVVRALSRDGDAPASVRVDSIPSVAIEEGALGQALASTIIEAVPLGGRRYSNGSLIRDRVGAGASTLTLPDGTEVTIGNWPSGDLVIAHRISGAPNVTASTTEVPTGRAVRLLAPVASLALRVPALQRLAIGRLARVRLGDRPAPRENSWGHAVVVAADGESRESWLKLGDASAFTADTMAGVAIRLARGDADPGAHSPIGAVGPDIVADAGGMVLA